MKEIEVKILEVRPAEVIKKLRRFGARRTFDGEIRAAYYDYPGHKLRKAGSVLRLRTKGGRTELTFKARLQKSRAKIMREEEIVLSEPGTAERILKGLGLRAVSHFRKRRISHAVGQVHFELDYYPGLPPFLEIEAPSLTVLEKWVKKLGFAMADARPWSTYDVMRHYRKK